MSILSHRKRVTPLETLLDIAGEYDWDLSSAWVQHALDAILQLPPEQQTIEAKKRFDPKSYAISFQQDILCTEPSFDEKDRPSTIEVISRHIDGALDNRHASPDFNVICVGPHVLKLISEKDGEFFRFDILQSGRRHPETANRLIEQLTGKVVDVTLTEENPVPTEGRKIHPCHGFLLTRQPSGKWKKSITKEQYLY